MTNEEQGIWLIKKLLSERIEYKRCGIPEDEQEQKDLLRSLMNVRMPHGISEDFLKIQDEYLQVENARGVFMFPNQRAAEIAVKTVKEYLDETGSEIRVLINVFKDQDLKIYRGLVDK